MPHDELPYKGPFHNVPDEDMIVIRDRSEIPRFANEEEEAAFWDTHTLAEHLWRKERGPRPGSLAEKLSQQRFRPHAVYTKDDDAVYVYLAWGRRGASRDLDASRRVDYAVDGVVTGVQLLNSSRGVDLRGVPQAQAVKDLLKTLDLRTSI